MSSTLSRRALLTGSASLIAAPLFGTVPARARDPDMVSVLVGDWGRNGHDHQREVAAEMARVAERSRSIFTVSLGDNFYEDGVSGVDDPQWRSSFEDIYDAPSLQTPWRIILGNHDYRGSVEAQLRYGANGHKRWLLPARYYSVRDRLPDGTTIDSFYIDTSPFLKKYRHSIVRIDDQDPRAQQAWLSEALGRSDADWKFVIGHHPIHTGDGRHETPELIAAIAPLLRHYRVAAYISAHKHNFQHRRIGGIDYIVNGAGSRLDPAGVALGGAFTNDGQHGFMTMRVARDLVEIGFIGGSGKTLFSRRIPRPTAL
ncbi:metallophosphoesterase [Gluconacetobacter sacchari]|uniref:metallophosphoesterase n=1 Tax=Gluconacetobacter sacchari TaxID=92759 RepID=UPI002232AA82|nr:metallophosphoesterase [Gluconacetobacter sacchari]